MSAVFKLLALIIAITPRYDVTSKPSLVRSDLWEPHPEGVSIALSLTSKTENGERCGSLVLYMKNTSSSVKRFVIDSSDTCFQIYTRDADGEDWRPIRDYNPKMIGMAAPVSIDPGHIGSHVIELNAYDLTLIKSRLVQCRILFVDAATNHRCYIQSSPKLLTESVTPAPTK